MPNHVDRAQLLHSLHVSGRPLVLPNAWDVASARLIEDAGATAVATTSAGVSWSLGARDGNLLDRDRAIDLIARVAAAVSVPVTADIEAGYGEDASGVGETVARVLDAGAVGVNLEDAWHGGAETLYPVETQAERIAAARAAAEAAGVPLFINARMDTYLRGVGAEGDRLALTVRRAEAYLAAGASGIFVPGVLDAPTISALTSAIGAPVNIMVGPGAPSVAELAALGVARISLGSAVAEAAYAVARRAARELVTDGTYTSIADGVPYGELNALL